MKTDCEGLVRIFIAVGADHKFFNSLISEGSAFSIKYIGINHSKYLQAQFHPLH